MTKCEKLFVCRWPGESLVYFTTPRKSWCSKWDEPPTLRWSKTPKVRFKIPFQDRREVRRNASWERAQIDVWTILRYWLDAQPYWGGFVRFNFFVVQHWRRRITWAGWTCSTVPCVTSTFPPTPPRWRATWALRNTTRTNRYARDPHRNPHVKYTPQWNLKYRILSFFVSFATGVLLQAETSMSWKGCRYDGPVKTAVSTIPRGKYPHKL